METSTHHEMALGPVLTLSQLAGRPLTSIGTDGAINTQRDGARVVGETRVRDLDGGLRQVRASGPAAALTRAIPARRLKYK